MTQKTIKIIRKQGTPVGEINGVLSFLALIQEGSDDAALAMIHIDAEGNDPAPLRSNVEEACWMETGAYRVTPEGVRVKPEALVIRG